MERLKDRVGEEKALVTGRTFKICDDVRSTVVTLADVEGSDTCMGRPEIATKGCEELGGESLGKNWNLGRELEH